MLDLLMFKFVGLPLFLLFIIIENILYLKKFNTIGWKFRLVFYSFSIYLLFILNYTIFPIPIGEDSKFMFGIMELKNNFIPFRTLIIDELLSFPRYFIGNLILLMPLGIYIPIIFKKYSSVYRVTVYGFLTSLGIELMQLLVSKIVGVTYRTFNVDDLILNTLGVIIGYLLFKLIKPIIIPFMEKDKSNLIRK